MMAPADELGAWIEWKQLCELARCSPSTCHVLDAFGDRALSIGMSKLPLEVRNNIGRAATMPGYGFALLEKHALEHVYTERVRDSRLHGKTYKIGLFQKAEQSSDPPLKVLRGSGTNMIRTAAREMWIAEADRLELTSLEEALCTDGDLRLEDLLADSYEYEDSDVRELLAIAREEAPRLFDAVPFVQRVVLLARALGISYSNSRCVMQVTGKGSSSLGDQFRYIYKRRDYLPLLVEKFPNEDPETMDLLYRMVLAVCEEMAVGWGRSEIRCGPLFDELGS